MNEEGWYIDPYGHYEARWFSDGTPTALVRNGGAEDHDPPPDGPIPGELERVPETHATGSNDLKRADDAGKGSLDPNAGRDAAFNVFNKSGLPNF
jgi:hypothetical protein